MHLSALIHLIEATQALTRCDHVTVLGSAALLATDATLGEPGAQLELTRDADLLLDPCDEALAALVHEALGEGSLFDQRFGGHVDVLRPDITATLAAGWAARTVPVGGTGARALAPEDVAAAKLRVGRAKDMELVAYLFAARTVDADAVAVLLRTMTWTEREMHQAVRNWGRLAGRK